MSASTSTRIHQGTAALCRQKGACDGRLQAVNLGCRAGKALGSSHLCGVALNPNPPLRRQYVGQDGVAHIAHIGFVHSVPAQIETPTVKP